MSNYNGVKTQEIEYTVYAKLPDLAILETAPHKEVHEQWQLPLAKDGPVRTRLRLVDNRTYTMTTKAKRPGVTGSEEVDYLIPEPAWKHLREMCTDGYKKTRYMFPVFNFEWKWEIDVFMDKSGQPSNWVKIDVEVGSKTEDLPLIDVDLKATEFIISNHPSMTQEQSKRIDDLWASEWQQINGVSINASK